MKGQKNKTQITLITVNDNRYICLSNNYSSNLIAYLCNNTIHLALEIVVIKRVSAAGHQGIERNPQRKHIRLQKMAAECTGSVDQLLFKNTFFHVLPTMNWFMVTFSLKGVIIILILLYMSCQTVK